jgi:DNA-binding IscR family transcriptional regulator
MRQRDRLALMIIYLISLNFAQDKARWTLISLTRRLKLPPEPICEILESLVQNKILIKLDADASYIPAKDLEAIKTKELLQIVRKEDKGLYMPWKHESTESPIRKLIRTMDESEEKAIENISANDLIKQ